MHIKLKEISIVCHQRHVVEVDNIKMPMTISLIGNHENYFGIKAVIYNRQKRKEDGVFLRVSGDEWKYDEPTIKEMPPVRKRDPLKYFYSLPQHLEDVGFEYIYKNLRFNPDKIPFVENDLGELVNVDVFTKSTVQS